MIDDVYTANTEHIEGKTIVKTLGLVKGSTVQAKWLGKDIMAGLRNLVGGELKEYTEMLDEARNIALERMKDDARSLGANAVVNVRFATAQVKVNDAEILAYGTAVM